MPVVPLDDRMLELFVSKKYHWKSLSPDEQQSMAVELMKSRAVIKDMSAFIDIVTQDKEMQRKYRELVSNETM
jgi:hypothetical protein